ncbi:Dirigent protein 15 [Zea mays]|uniref:Dirigent protein n=1 Tax=Zea mays TaxID=4577 RepID=A0A3L6EF88_MAIZE|nr:Dirigent protein 15 [Zea mays]
MASPTQFLIFPLISLVILAAILASPSAACGEAACCHRSCEQELRFPPYFFCQRGGGTNPNQNIIVPSSYPFGFGTIFANDYEILDAPQQGAKVIARARGMLIQVDQAAGNDWQCYFSIVFQDDSFGGSTLKVIGDNKIGATGEWSIIGGTGKLSMARGSIKYNIVKINEVENYRQLDIYVIYTPLAV